MAEKVVVRQNNDYEISFWTLHEHDAEDFHPVAHIHNLTPYGMMLASLGSCAAILLHSFAQNHGIDLQEVALQLTYDRAFQDDCDNCENISRYQEQIEVEVTFSGNLTPEEHEKLRLISRQCPIQKILEDGIQIREEVSQRATYSLTD